MSRGNPIVGVRLDPKLYERLVKLAREEGCTVSTIIRCGIYDIVESMEQDKKEKAKQAP